MCFSWAVYKNNHILKIVVVFFFGLFLFYLARNFRSTKGLTCRSSFFCLFVFFLFVFFSKCPDAELLVLVGLLIQFRVALYATGDKRGG